MSNVDKLKRKAAELEQKKQYDRALDLYVQVLDKTTGTPEERDVPLYNRVGDLHLRLGNTEKAVTYYEKAVDLYADGGYLNNAIALCNKILRHSPGRNSIYYKLGRISAKKGFNSDAKQNFLEYADRMQKQGKMDEAFRALEEFADLCPGQDDIRLLLADQLTRAGRKDEALEQLQILHEALDADGRSNEAAAALERMRSIDPNVQPRRASVPRSRESGGLVFLDLNETPRPSTPPVKGLEPTALVEEAETAAAARKTPTPHLPGLETTAIEEKPEPSPVVSELAQAKTVEAERAQEAEAAEDEAEEEAAGVEPLAGLPLVTEGEPVEHVAAVTKRRSDDDYVSLADWLAEDAPRSTRMVASDERRAVEGQADFSEMLEKFKEGVAANVDDADAESHYDLGVAYREMGLLDEAISEFQTALRAPDHRIRTYEALGQCFIDKFDYDVAMNVLMKALEESPGDDTQLVGVLYLMGLASEGRCRWNDASAYYQRVTAVDIDFRDVGQRIEAVGRPAK